MIITKTPFRMSFFGGGTDFPDFYNEYGGSVLSTTIDKYCYVYVRHLPPFFEYSTELSYSIIEKVTDINNIKHPAIREAMKYLDIRKIRLSYEADLPARAGLGTSSAFAVGMLSAFYALKGKLRSNNQLADDAIYLERTLCKEVGGTQDQIAAAYGGFNKIEFSESTYTVNPVIISNSRRDLLCENLIMFFTGFTRFSADIHARAKKTVKENEKELNEMKQLVYEAEKILTSKAELTEFGRLLDYTWKLKRGLSSGISTDFIDNIYEKALKSVAVGGKLLGAGGGGFLVFYCEKEKQKALIAKLNGLLHVPFRFENDGTRIVHHTAEDYEI